MNDMEKGEGTLKRSKTKGSSKKKERVDGDSSDEESERRVHKLTERERRKKMKNMFNDLHALLPQLPSKAEKCTIVDEAIKYISTLQETLKSLEKQKKKMKLQGKQPLGHQSATPSEAIIGSASRTPARHPELPGQQQQLPSIVNNNDIFGGSAIGGAAVPVSFLTWFSPYVVLNKCGDGAMINVCSPRKPGLLSAIFNILYKHNLDVLSAQLFGDEHRCVYAIHARAAVGNSSGHLPMTLAAADTFKLATDEMHKLISSCS